MKIPPKDQAISILPVCAGTVARLCRQRGKVSHFVAGGRCGKASLQRDGEPCVVYYRSRFALRVDCKRCYYIPMRRLLTFFMLFILVVANSAAVAGAICRHAGVADHEAARKSEDARIAGVALNEEAADSVASKRAALADPGPVAWAADFSPGPQLTVPAVTPRAVDAEMALARPLIGRSLAPLLKPPAA